MSNGVRTTAPRTLHAQHHAGSSSWSQGRGCSSQPPPRGPLDLSRRSSGPAVSRCRRGGVVGPSTYDLRRGHCGHGRTTFAPLCHRLSRGHCDAARSDAQMRVRTRREGYSWRHTQGQHSTARRASRPQRSHRFSRLRHRGRAAAVIAFVMASVRGDHGERRRHGGSRTGRRRIHRHRRRPAASSSSRSRSRSGTPTRSQPSNPCGTLVGTGPNQIPDRAHVVRPAHRRRLVQQPLRPDQPGPHQTGSAPPTSRSRG